MTAIFLLVILASLGAAIVYISGVQQISSGLDIQGARAYQAARAGIEWGLYQQIKAGSCVDAPGTSFTLPAGTTLSTFTVTVICHATPGAVATLNRWQITSTACNAQPPATSCVSGIGGGTGFVQRVMQVDF
ncbi:MAG: agglutinin biogenesis protein MshP [Burkholderiaceae bacterium]